jgi:hypothetical protein
MAKLTELNINAISIVRGDDFQPSNPGAVALVYKAHPKTPKEKDAVEKTNQQGAPVTKQSLAVRISKAVQEVLKGTTTYVDESSYSSQSRSTTTVTEQPDPSMGEQMPVVVVVQDSVEKTAPAASAAPEPPANAAQEVITKAVTDALAPIRDEVTKMGDRLATIEKQSTGSRRLDKSIPTGGVEVKEGQYGEFNQFLKSHYGLTAGQKLTKTTLSSAGWSYGLSYAEAGSFIDYIVDQSVVLKQCRTVKMPNVKYNIDKIGLTGNVLVKATPGTDPGDTATVSTPTQVQLSASEVIAIVSIGDDTLEDNIEGEALVQHILGMIGRTAANQLEGAALMGDTGTADTGILDRWDGWNKLARANGAHVIEGMADADRKWPGTAPVGSKMTKLLKTLPTKYRNDPSLLRLLINSDLYLDYTDAIATIAVPEAFKAVAGVTDLPIRSVPNVRMPLLPQNISFTYSATPYTDGTFVMLTNVQNLIFGIHRDIKIEPYRQPRKRATDYVISLRAAVQIENGDAIAIYDHLKVQ